MGVVRAHMRAVTGTEKHAEDRRWKRMTHLGDHPNGNSKKKRNRFELETRKLLCSNAICAAQTCIINYVTANA